LSGWLKLPPPFPSDPAGIFPPLFFLLFLFFPERIIFSCPILYKWTLLLHGDQREPPRVPWKRHRPPSTNPKNCLFFLFGGDLDCASPPSFLLWGLIRRIRGGLCEFLFFSPPQRSFSPPTFGDPGPSTFFFSPQLFPKVTVLPPETTTASRCVGPLFSSPMGSVIIQPRHYPPSSGLRLSKGTTQINLFSVIGFYQFCPFLTNPLRSATFPLPHPIEFMWRLSIFSLPPHTESWRSSRDYNSLPSVLFLFPYRNNLISPFQRTGKC